MSAPGPYVRTDHASEGGTHGSSPSSSSSSWPRRPHRRRHVQRLVTLRNRCDNAWSQVDVQLRRRYDLIPNLVETVKGYAKHESGVFEKVTLARSAAVNAQGVKAQGEAENMLTGALKSLFAVAEAYPDLKANQNFLMLQEELAGTESKVAYARQFYNDTVMKFNMRQQTSPQASSPTCSASSSASSTYRRRSGQGPGQGPVLIPLGGMYGFVRVPFL